MLLEKCIMGYYSILLWVLQFNSFSVSSPLTAFPGFITIVDCQRTYLVVGLPDLLFPASNVIGSEKLSAGACSPSSSWPPDAGESWSNATRRCSSRQLKQKLFPSFIIWTFPMIYTQVNFYRHGGQSGIQGALPLTVPAMWSSRNASPLCWRSFKRTARKKGWYTSCNCAWEQLRRLLKR